MARLDGAFGPDARFGVKRGKTETADGSAVNVRLAHAPESFDRDGFALAARHGIVIRGTADGGRFADKINRAGIVAEYIVRGVMANADDDMVPPETDAAPADAIADDAVPAPRRNGRKPASV
jgi:hypothetical protein